MEKQEKVIRHLEMIQNIVNRMGRNSFMLKGWAVVLSAASVWLMARTGANCLGEKNNGAQYAVIFVVGWLWLLDGYFLRQERLFRKLYDKVRQSTDTDFAMNPMQFSKSVPGWIATCLYWKPWPPTLLIFYAPLMVALVFLF